jgi:hypothetical protein
MFDQALRITFSRRVNLDDIGRAVTLLFQYAEVRLELGKLSAGEGIVVFRNGARRLLDREEAEELAEELMALYVNHVAGRRGLEERIYRTIAAAPPIIDDIAAARGAIPPSELVDA